jgi:hypothetical protein
MLIASFGPILLHDRRSFSGTANINSAYINSMKCCLKDLPWDAKDDDITRTFVISLIFASFPSPCN